MYETIRTPLSSSLKALKVTILVCFGFAFPCAPLIAQETKDNHAVTGHATVEIVFVIPFELPNAELSDSGPRAIVGNAILPFKSIHPISISIDGEFVGHALTGIAGIKPVYALPHGKHRFEVACDGFKTAKSELTVIGTGSKQYLVVKLEPTTSESPKAKTTTESSAPDKPR